MFHNRPSIRSLPPEIVDKIARLLLPRPSTDIGGRSLCTLSQADENVLDLVNFAETCRGFREICLPIIFSNIRFSGDRAGVFAERLREMKIRENNVKHMTIVIHVSSFGEWSPSLLSGLEIFKNVNTLVLVGVPICQATMRALKFLHNIRTLSIDSILSPIFPAHAMARDEDYELMPPLRTLILDVDCFIPEAYAFVASLLRSIHASLEEINIRCGDSDDVAPEWGFIKGLKLDTIIFPRLRNLQTNILSFFPSSLWTFVMEHRDTIEYIEVECNEACNPIALCWVESICAGVTDERIPAMPDVEAVEKRMVAVDQFSARFEDSRHSLSDNKIQALMLSRGDCHGKKTNKVLTELSISLIQYESNHDDCKIELQYLLQPQYGTFERPSFRSISTLAFRTLYEPEESFSELMGLLSTLCSKHLPNLRSIVIDWDTQMMCWAPDSPRIGCPNPGPTLDDNTGWDQWEKHNYCAAKDIISAFMEACPNVERVEWQLARFDYSDTETKHHSWVWVRDAICDLSAPACTIERERGETRPRVSVVGTLSVIKALETFPYTE
ncbi:hypothetical protein DFH11DRAFT_1620900 [Phellopilus nigrolimitatus]|nr:hypothetical protein DFH11DRAFT_1620900 [Phellopilus nigrolimitatus]